VVTSAQIAAGTLNVNETIRVAEAGAAEVARRLAAGDGRAPAYRPPAGVAA
jgi:hypothetical protein